MRTRGFTLIEVVAASVLTTVLLGIVLSATATISLDRKRLATASAATAPADTDSLLQLLRHDLTNARSFISPDDGQSLTIVGYGGLARESFRPAGRLARITYRVRSVGRAAESRACLVREQHYLDDVNRPDDWSELVAVGVTRLTVSAASPDTNGLPLQISVQIDTGTHMINQRLWLR